MSLAISAIHTAVAFSVAEEYKQNRVSNAPVVILSTASPYKFPGVVLEAIGGELQGDEFEQMARLEALSGVPVPKGLAGLREKEELHKDLIDAASLLSYVQDRLKEMEG